MTTVGEILKNKRVELNLSLPEVEKATKIRHKFLTALESDDFSTLPAAYTRGFIQNYARYLKLNENEILAFYRRQTNSEKTKILPNASEVVRPKFVITPTLITVAGVLFTLLFLIGYLVQQYFFYTGAPALEIKTPNDYVVINTSPIEVAGKTEPGVNLTINNQDISVSDDGSFKINVDISSGLNTLEIIAKNKFNRQTKITRHVRLQSE